MARVERTIIVRASPKTVFDYLNDPRNFHALVPGAMAIEIEDVEPVAAGGWKFRWTWSLHQFEFEGIGECMIHIPNQYSGYIMSGELHNDLAWSLKPLPTGTEVLMHITFEIPEPLQRIETLQTIPKEYLRAVKQTLTHLQLQLEVQAQAVG